MGSFHIMGFGRYEGYEIEDVPRSYLEWCVDNLVPSTEHMLFQLDRIQRFLHGERL